MSAASYLYRRSSGIYFARFCVPAALRGAVGKREVHRSTGCRHLHLAKIVAAQLAESWHRSLSALRTMDIKTIATGSPDLLGEGLLSIPQAAQAIGIDIEQLLLELQALHGRVLAIGHCWDGWRVPDIHALDHEPDLDGEPRLVIDPPRLDHLGERCQLRDLVEVRFLDEVLRAVQGNEDVHVCQFMFPGCRDRAFIVDLPGVALSTDQLQVRRRDAERVRVRLKAQIPASLLPLEAPPQLQALPASPSGTANVSPKFAAMRLSDLVKKFIDAHAQGWRPNTLSTNKDRAEALVGLVGDLRLDEIDRPTLSEFGIRARKLPANRNQTRLKFNEPDADFKRLIELADAHGLKRLTPASVGKLVNGAMAVFAWGAAQEFLLRNPAAGLGKDAIKAAGTKQGKSSPGRELFDTAELKQIFSASWYQTGKGELTAEGTYYQYRPHYYWLPLMGLLIGGRINELSQLYLTDVRSDGSNNWYVSFNLEGPDKVDADDNDEEAEASSTDKSLKTINSERNVPLHPWLIDLGLVEFVAALKNDGHQRLFPELKHDAVKGYGKAAGRWFNERYLGRKLGIVRNGRKTFHSLRHQFSTLLDRAGTPEKATSQLLGHSRGQSMAQKIYIHERETEELAPFIKLLDLPIEKPHPFDVSTGLQSIRDAIALKRSQRPAHSK